MRRIPMIIGDEFDALTSFRHYRLWHAGQRAKIKRHYRRRERHEEKRMLLDSRTEVESAARAAGVTVYDYRTEEEKAQQMDAMTTERHQAPQDVLGVIHEKATCQSCRCSTPVI